MKGQNSQPDGVMKSKRLLSLIFVAISILGFFSLAFVSGNYLDALSIPLIIGFIWLGVVKQKLAWAVALVAFYVMLAVPAIVAEYMNGQFLTPILMTVILIVLGNAIYRLPLRKSVVIVTFFVLSLLLLYAFDFVDTTTIIPLIIGVGAGLLGVYLFPQWRQSSSQQ